MRQKDIFFFWLPLFASWLLMTSEGPIVSAAINRLPNEVVMLAAMGIVVSLSVTIESPIMNLLATSTTLSKDRQSFLLIRKFTLHWMVLLTAITILIAWTPIFDFLVIDFLEVPKEVATWVQPGMRIMTFWSAAIAWRRFLQGIIIRFNQTRKVALGTIVRIIASGGTVVALAIWSNLSGVVIGSIALMAGVLAEAIYATIAVQPILRYELSSSQTSKETEPLTYRELTKFHMPLAATSVLVLFTQPLVTYTLARSPNPTLSLAAWPMVFQIMLVARAAAFALPEVVIALSNGEATFRPIRKFTYALIFANTIAMAVFVLTPLSSFYLERIQDATSEVTALATDGLLFFLPLPALALLISWIRGLLISNRVTTAVNTGMIANLFVTILILFIGTQMQWPGIVTAAAALTLAAFIETIYIAWRVNGALGFRFKWFEIQKDALPG